MKPQRSPFLLGIFGLTCFLFFILFLGLGIWQIERLAWKTNLIERVNSRIHLPPVAAPAKDQWASVNTDDSAYLPVKVKGHFLFDREVYVIAVANESTGYWVMTPLKRDDGSIILINRGFIPMELKNKRLAPPTEDQQLTVTGLLRISEGPGFFPRRNDPDHNIWYSRDVPAIAKKMKLNLAEVAPYFIDEKADEHVGAYPTGGLTMVSFPNSHLTYSITWFLLAAGVLVGSAYVFLGERRRRHCE